MTNPHDVSVRALIAFPRERTCCVVIVISKGQFLGSLPSPGDCAIDTPLKDTPSPRVLIGLKGYFAREYRFVESVCSF